MGIKDLSQFLRKNYPDSFETLNLSDLGGQRIAIDMSIYLHKYIKSVGEDLWLKVMINMLFNLLVNDIQIVCIFDGANPPIEKLQEREIRASSSYRVNNIIAEVNDIVETITESEEVTQEQITRIKELRNLKKTDIDAVSYNNVNMVLNTLNTLLQKKQKQIAKILPSYSTVLQEFLTIAGIPYIVADGEAETLCSYLCIKGEVDGVLSEDTDVLVYGTPIFYSKLKGNSIVRFNFDNLLKELNMDKQEFRDFCIMCGCDYTSHARMINITGGRGAGIVTCMKLITKYRTIERIKEKESKWDTAPIKYERCREIFNIDNYDYDKYISILSKYNTVYPELEEVQAFLSKHNIRLDTVLIKNALNIL